MEHIQGHFYETFDEMEVILYYSADVVIFITSSQTWWSKKGISWNIDMCLIDSSWLEIILLYLMRIDSATHSL